MSDNQHQEINSEEVYPEISIKECLIEGWDMFKKHWLVILFVEIFFLIFNMSDRIPYIGDFVSVILYPPLIAGSIFFYINVGNDSQPSFKNLQKGFSLFWLSTGMFWFLILIVAVCLIPSYLLIDFDVTQSISYSSLFDSDMIITYTNLILIIFVFIRYTFAYYILVDEPKQKLFKIFKRSSQLIQGNVFQFAKLLILCFSLLIFIYFLLSSYKPTSVVSDASVFFEFNLSIYTLALSAIFYLCINYLLYSIFYISVVRFYLKLKEIKPKPPFTITNDPI